MSHPEGGANATTEGSAQRGSGWFLVLADSSVPRSDLSIKN